ncbi:MAG: LPO_1073/Vpar_1526 family protein [Enterococcus aquimarinus]
MMNKQDARGGENSTVNQAGGDVKVSTTINYGMGYTETKDLFMDLFHIEFTKLGKDVEHLINERAEKIVVDYLNKLVQEDPNLIQNTKNPDIRYDIIEAQKAYARLGDQEMADLLVKILVERTKSTENTFKNIALNESLSVIPKLTSKQIDVITLIYLVRYYSFVPTFKMPFDFYYQTLVNFLAVEIPNSEMFYQHLQYSGCLSISIGSSSFASIFMHKFPHLFKDETEVNSFISSYSDVSQLKNKWDNTKMCNTSLTSVGLVIAITNINRIMNYTWDVGIWFQEN